MDIGNTVEASFSCKIWVLPAMNKMTLVFWDVKPYSLVHTEAASSSRNLLTTILGFTTYEYWSPIFSKCFHPIDMLNQSDQIATNVLIVGLQVTLFISPQTQIYCNSVSWGTERITEFLFFSDVTRGRLAVTDVSGKLVGPKCRPKTSINSYQSMPRNIPEKQRSPSHHGGRLNSRNFPVPC